MGFCKKLNCKKYASYNIASGKPKFCGEHKAMFCLGMIDIRHKTCVEPDCYSK